MFDLYGISNFLGTVTNLAVAVFVVLKGGRSNLSKIWSIFTTSVAIYSFGAFMAVRASNYDMAFVWWQFSYVGVIMLAPLFMHFVYVFLGVKSPFLLRLVYIFSGLIIISNVFSRSLFIGNVKLLFVDSKWFSPVWWVFPPGPIHVFYVVFFYVGLLSFLFFKLFIAYKNTSGVKRTQYRYFMIATAVGFIGGGTSFLPCFGLNIYPILNITVPFYTILIAYAIIRHNLMGIEIIVRKTIVFAGLVIISYSVFAGFAYMSAMLFENIVRSRWLAMVPSIFVVVLILRPLENFLREATDKYLFQKKYDYKYLLRKFSDEVLTVLDLSSLVQMTVSTLTEIVKLEGAAIFLYSEKENSFVKSVSLGPGSFEVFSDELVLTAERSGGYLLRPDDSDIRNRKTVQDFDLMRASLIVPLSHRNKTVGALVLGRKLSDESITQDDVDIMLTLAKTLSVAIVNARLFEQLSVSQAQDAQREKMAVIGTLSAGINHEICNPLGIIRGHCEMFLLNMRDGIYKDRDPKELLEKASEIMKIVVRETDRASAITKKLSSFAKPASGQLVPGVSVIDEIEEVISLVEHDLRLENIEITRHFEENLPLITADKKQVQEIFFNIIRNAAQAIKKDGRIDIQISRSGREVSVKIKDSGGGIKGGDIEKIFNPFFTTKDPGVGSGLGLFIVKQIVERNNGSISVKSDPGVGAEFTVVFTVRQTAHMVEA